MTSEERNGHPLPGERRDATRQEIAAVLSEPGASFIVAAHHNADGDAIGSMLGLARALRAAGHDVVLAHPDPEPVPQDLRFMLDEDEVIVHALPEDAEQRTFVAVDCATANRLWYSRPPHHGVRQVLNLDHHHDNTRFGHLNLVEPTASSSAEVVAHVLEAAGWPLTKHIAEPLYVGLVTDTGRFSYANTGPEAHRVAAALIEAGADPEELSRQLFDELPAERLLLLGRAMQTARLLSGGHVMAAALGPDDFAVAGGDDTEGIVEAMRSVRGVQVAALARQVRHGAWRVSVRSDSDRVDVSAIAREEGGGGHRRAAGFTTQRPPDDLFAWLELQVDAQLNGG
ncbi:MAG: DHH family phosphoesterase [Thermoleophilia bacterium]